MYRTMKRNEKERIMQRKIIFQVMFLAMLLVMIAGCQKKEANLEVDVEIGYDQVVKISEGNPLSLTMRNLGEAVDGEIQIDIATDGQEQIVLAVPFDISQGAEKVFDLHIPIYTVQKKFPIRIVVENATVYEDEMTVRQFLSPERAVVGVITDQPDQYRFFNQMELSPHIRDEERYAYERATVEQAAIPTESVHPHIIYFDSVQEFNDKEALSFFDYIYMGNASNLGFSQVIESNVFNWIQQGNTLFIETGANYQRSMNQLPESLKQVNFSEVREETLDFTGSDLPFVGEATLAYGDRLRQDISLIQENDKVLGYAERLGAGRLITLSMDLSAKPLARWNADGLLLSHLMNILDVKAEMIQGQINYYGNNSYQLRYIPMEKQPPYGLMALILGIYSILVGPITYYVLKRKDRRDLMWIAVPAMAITCVTLIYLLGFMTRYDKPISNSISEINYHQGQQFLEINSEIALFNNKNNQMTVSWDSDESFMITSLNNSNYYGDTRENKQTKGKLFLGTRAYYESYDTTLWEPTYATGKKVVPIEKQEIDETAQIGIFDEHVEFTVTNPTPIRIEYTVAVWGNQLYEIGTLEPYGQKTISGEGQKDVYQYLEQTYQMSQFYQNPGAYSSQLRNDVSFLEDHLYRTYEKNRNISTDQMVLIGLNKDEVGYAIQINEKDVDEYSRNIVALNMDYHFDFGDQVDLPYGFLQASIGVERHGYIEEGYSYMDGQYETIDLYEAEKVYYTWRLPDGLSADKVKLKLEELYTNEAYYNKLRNNLGQTSSKGEAVDILIKNIQTQEWEPIEASVETFDLDVSKYLSTDNEVSVCYDMTGLNRMSRDYIMIVPGIGIEGGVVND